MSSLTQCVTKRTPWQTWVPLVQRLIAIESLELLTYSSVTIILQGYDYSATWLLHPYHPSTHKEELMGNDQRVILIVHLSWKPGPQVAGWVWYEAKAALPGHLTPASSLWVQGEVNPISRLPRAQFIRLVSVPAQNMFVKKIPPSPSPKLANLSAAAAV